MTRRKLFTESEATGLLDRLASDWPLLLHDGVVIDHILKVIAAPADRAGKRDGTVLAWRPRTQRRVPRRAENNLGAASSVTLRLLTQNLDQIK
jgi:hypothetical protein